MNVLNSSNIGALSINRQFYILPALPKGRKKTSAVPSASKVNANLLNFKMIDSIYRQFDSILKKTKVSKRELASRVSMSYQGFLNSYNKKHLTLEKWVTISKFLNLPLTIQFELGSKPKRNPLRFNPTVMEL